MRKHLLMAVAAAGLMATGSAARAAVIVHDPTSYLKLVAQAQTALHQLTELKTQVRQGQELFASLNDLSDIGSIASLLDVPELRQVLPQIEGLAAAAKGDLSALGKIGARADEIRAEARLFTATPGDGAGGDLEASGNRAARDLALGEAVATAGSERLKGLQQLQRAIEVAPNARAVLDLQARATTEQAMIANDQMRLQGLAMTQAAEERLELQRARERMTAARQSRMDAYRQGFQ